MCLLTLAPAGITHSRADLETACYANPDGFGYAIHTGRHIIRRRSMDCAALIDRYLEDRSRNLDGPALFHARIATSGKVDNSGCHPFYLPGTSKVVLGHNGILPLDDTGWKSDTRYLVEDILGPDGGVDALRNAKYLDHLERWIGKQNKLVILSADRRLPPYLIVNESAGHWTDGIWWSNYSYETYVWKPLKDWKPSLLPGSTYAATSADIAEFYELCDNCLEPLSETALEEGQCEFCYCDIYADVEDTESHGTYCACDDCRRKLDAELDALRP